MTGPVGILIATAFATAMLATATPAAAQISQPPAAKPEMNESCPGLIARNRPRATPASLRLALNADEIRVNYIGHSTFMIESPAEGPHSSDFTSSAKSLFPSRARTHMAPRCLTAQPS